MRKRNTNAKQREARVDIRTQKAHPTPLPRVDRNSAGLAGQIP